MRLYAFSTSTMAPSTSTPMEMAMPASDMRLALRPISFMGMKASATDTGMVTMGTMDEGKCQRKMRMISETMMISSISLSFTVSMAASDQLGAVVGGDDLHALGQRGLELVQLRLHPVDDVERVLALAHHHDAAHHVALAVEVGDAAPHLRAQRDGGHVA